MRLVPYADCQITVRYFEKVTYESKQLCTMLCVALSRHDF